MLDWLIIGGGIHGTYLSLYLTRRRNVPHDRLKVLDPHPEPLALWNHFTLNTGMEFLRSSHAHNLHFDPFSLATFTRTQAGEGLARFIEPYGRPSLELFSAHIDTLMTQYRLNEMRLVGRATGLVRLEDGWRVETDGDPVEAHHVIVAIGNTERPYWPDWALELKAAGAAVQHIFDPAFQRQDLPAGVDTLVVGGGITAVQTALALSLDSPGQVTLLMRHAPRIHQFDSDTGWITPDYLKDFHRETDYARRREIIKTARHRGSMPKDVAEELQKGLDGGLLVRREGEVQEAVLQPSSTPGIQVTLTDGKRLTASQIILTTGFETTRPGGAWLDKAISDYDLPLAPDGYPIVDKRLCWAPGLYVTGPLAELEVGPVSRNIIGVRLAAERIGASL